MDGLFSNILNMSISASWLILAVILLRAILAKAPKGFRYILWALVAIRLLCPFSIESSFSLVPEGPQFGQELQNLDNVNSENANSDILNSEKVDHENENQNQGNIIQGNLSHGNISQDSVSQDSVSQDNVGQDTLDKLPSTTVTVTPNENTSDTNNQIQDSVIITDTNTIDTNTTKTDIPESKRTWSEVFTEAMPWVWFTDGILMLVYILVSYLVLWNKVKVSIPVGENTYICDEVRSPFILGIVRPRIYVPSSITREQMTYIMAHEKEHLRCFDYIWKPFGFVILAIHWFNPLVWIAYILMCRDLELACDERVIRNMSAADKRNYSETLMACSSPRNYISACPIAFGEIGIKERIKRVFSYKKPTVWIVGIAVIACIVIAVCFMTSPKTETSGEPSTETESESESETGTETETETETGSEGESESDSGIEPGDDFDDNCDWNTYVPNINDIAKVTYNDNQTISLNFVRVYYVEGTAHPTDSCYGMTVDKQNGVVKYLSDYIPSVDALVNKLEKADYTIVAGEIQLETNETIIEYVKEQFTEKNWEAYYSNFYLDSDGICVIFSTPHSDYSIIRITPDSNWKKETTENNQTRPQLMPDKDNDYEGELFSPYITDSVEIIYNTENELSLTSKRLLYIPPAAHPVSYFYGITVNETTNEITYVDEYVESLDRLIQVVKDGKYSVVYGEFELNTVEEIIKHLTYQFNEKEWSRYYSNFYVDKDYVYIIAGDTYGYYSVLKIDKQDLAEPWNSEVGVADEELNIFQKLLFNKETFHDGKKLSDLIQNIEYYHVVDLDEDGINEVVVETPDEKFFVFHLIDDEVYYYELKEKITSIFWDGTFETSYSTTYDYGDVNETGEYWIYYGNGAFTKEKFSYEVIASVWCDEAGTVHYYKGGESGNASTVEISKTDFNYLILNYDITKEGYVSWGSATVENILKEVTLEAQGEPEYPINVTVADSELSLMQKVLLNKATFNDGQKMTDVPWFFQHDEDSNLGGKYTDFCVVDLDHDGTDEVIVFGYDVLVLHEENNKVYGYLRMFRGMNPVCIDGTYWGSSGAADNDLCGNVSFGNYQMTAETFLSTTLDGSKEYGTAFYKNGGWWEDSAVEISYEEYVELVDQYAAEEATHYFFTLENILKYVD